VSTPLAYSERDTRSRATPPAVVRAFGQSKSPTGALAFHRRRWDDATGAAFALCTLGGESVGGVLLEPRDAGKADIGYWLLPEARGKGFASRGTRLVAEWALRDLTIARVQLWTTPENEASQRVAERPGFKREGTPARLRRRQRRKARGRGLLLADRGGRCLK
jgi:RimJ/RimL family protein N-acetyltransferase